MQLVSEWPSQREMSFVAKTDGVFVCLWLDFIIVISLLELFLLQFDIRASLDQRSANHKILLSYIVRSHGHGKTRNFVQIGLLNYVGAVNFGD